MLAEIRRRIVGKRLVDTILTSDAPPLGLTHGRLRVILYRIVGGADGIIDKITALATNRNAELEDKISLLNINNGMGMIIKKLKEMDLSDSLKKLATTGQQTLKDIVRNMLRYSDFLKYMSNANEYETKLSRSALRQVANDTQTLSQFASTLIYK